MCQILHKIDEKNCVYCKALKFDKVSNGIHLFVIGSCLLASIRQCSRLQLEQTKTQKGLKISAILYFWSPQLHPSSVAMQISLKQMQTSTILCIHFEYYLWISIKYLWTMMIEEGMCHSSRHYIVPQTQRQMNECKRTETRCKTWKQQSRSLFFSRSVSFECMMSWNAWVFDELKRIYISYMIPENVIIPLNYIPIRKSKLNWMQHPFNKNRLNWNTPYDVIQNVVAIIEMHPVI